MKELQRYLGDTAAADTGNNDWSKFKVMGYINQLVLTRHPPSQIGVRNERELITLGTGIDLLLSGRLAELGDLMIQRLKALETSLSDQSWQTARHQELIPRQGASLTGEMEKRKAARYELAASKLRGMLNRTKGQGPK